MSRLALLFAAGVAVLGLSQLRADDIDRVIARDKIAAGKLLSDASAALKDSVTLEKTSPAHAAALLEKSIAELRESRILPDEERNAWVGKLTARLRSVNDTVRAIRLAAEEKATRDAEEAIRKSREDGKKGSGVSGTAKAYIGSVADQVAASERLRKERVASTMSVFRSIDDTPIAIAGVVEFPKHWAAITDSPYRGSGKKLTPKEVALLKTLNSTMEVNFEGRRFREVIDYLQEKTHLPIIIDKLSLEDAGVDYDDPVTFKVPKVTVRTILKKVLGDRNLTYIIKEGTIQVVTPMKAREMMVIRTYPIADLVGGDPRYGLFIERTMMYNNVNNLIKTIQGAVEPSIWDVNGGTATISFHEPSQSLIVRAPAELHYMMGGGSLFK